MEKNHLTTPLNHRDPDEVPQAVSEEELFEAYLSARLEQALETLNQARDELAAQPNDFKWALAVMRRVHELRDIQAQLENQRDRVNVAREAAGLELETKAPAPSVQATPGTAFRAAQAVQADKVMAALATRPQTCPACQALVEPGRDSCGCGNIIDADASGTDHGADTGDGVSLSNS